MNLGNLLKEARRRRVFRIAGLYIVGVWVVVQIALAVFPALSVSESAIRYVWFAALAGVPIALLFGWRYDIRDGSVVRTPAGGGEGSLALERMDFLILAAIAAVALAILAGSLREIGEMEREQGFAVVPEDIDPASVAVLPFANMSADPDNEYFSDGLTDTLLHMLAQLDDLKVAARTSSFAFKQVNEDIRTIALALGVAHVLEGSVQKVGDTVRVTAQLIRADDGFHLWSQNYDRKLVDIFAIQDEIAADVASALGSSLLESPEPALRGVNTADFSAYDIYLQALEQQNIASYEALNEAEALFLAALEKDPDFFDAKLGLARNYLWKRYKGFEDGNVQYATAAALIDEVRIQFPGHVPAQVMDLLIQTYVAREDRTKWGQNEAIRAKIDEMLAIAEENRLDSFLVRSVVNIIAGFPYHRDEQALDLLRRALEEDPLNFELLWAQSRLLRIAGRLEEARQPLLTAHKLAPGNPEIPAALGFLSFSQGRYAEGLVWFRKAHELDPDDPATLSVIANVMYVLGFPEEGDYWFGRFKAMDPGPCELSRLEVRASEEIGARERLLEITARDLVSVVDEPTFCYHPIDFYVWTMSDEGRVQEALEHLGRLDPRVTDYTQLITDNRRTQYMQIMSIWLLGTQMEPQAYRALYERFMDLTFAEYPDWHDITASVYDISHAAQLGNLEEARTIFLDAYTLGQNGLAWHWRWLQFLRYPWLEDLRNDPEVLARINDYLAEKSASRDEVAHLLMQPEWLE